MSALCPQIVDECKTTIGGLQNIPQFVNAHDMASTPPEYAAIGARLAAIRVGFSDLSQKAWADLHGYGHTQYNNWENGTRRIPVETAEKLSDRYGLTLDAIYRGRLDGVSENARKVLSSSRPIAKTT